MAYEKGAGLLARTVISEDTVRFCNKYATPHNGPRWRHAFEVAEFLAQAAGLQDQPDVKLACGYTTTWSCGPFLVHVIRASHCTWESEAKLREPAVPQSSSRGKPRRTSLKPQLGLREFTRDGRRDPLDNMWFLTVGGWEVQTWKEIL